MVKRTTTIKTLVNKNQRNSQLRGVILAPVSPPALLQVWNWAQGTVYLTGALDDPYNQGSFGTQKSNPRVNIRPLKRSVNN